MLNSKTNSIFKYFLSIMVATFLMAQSSFASIANDVASEASDTAITTAVKAKLALEKDIPSLDVKVTTNSKVVHLEGKIDTVMQRNRVIEVASSVNNVLDVECSKLSVKSHPKNYLNDSLITSKIYGQIKRLELDKAISTNNGLRVETYDSVAHIWGYANSKNDLNIIETEAKKVKGVSSVKSNVEVR